MEGNEEMPAPLSETYAKRLELLEKDFNYELRSALEDVWIKTVNKWVQSGIVPKDVNLQKSCDEICDGGSFVHSLAVVGAQIASTFTRSEKAILEKRINRLNGKSESVTDAQSQSQPQI